jgi:hypothetical protein
MSMSIVTPFPAQLGSGIKMADSIIRYLQGLNLLLDTATLARLTGDSLMSTSGKSTAELWRGRAQQARRIASMLSHGDATLLLIYAQECDDESRAALNIGITDACEASADRASLFERPVHRVSRRRFAA